MLVFVWKLFCDFKYIVADKRKKKSNPVKLSTEDDLSSQECELILSKCVPASVRQVKTSMVLFLRYECVCHALQVCVCVCMSVLYLIGVLAKRPLVFHIWKIFDC